MILRIAVCVRTLQTFTSVACTYVYIRMWSMTWYFTSCLACSWLRHTRTRTTSRWWWPNTVTGWTSLPSSIAVRCWPKDFQATCSDRLCGHFPICMRGTSFTEMWKYVRSYLRSCIQWILVNQPQFVSNQMNAWDWWISWILINPESLTGTPFNFLTTYRTYVRTYINAHMHRYTRTYICVCTYGKYKLNFSCGYVRTYVHVYVRTCQCWAIVP